MIKSIVYFIVNLYFNLLKYNNIKVDFKSRMSYKLIKNKNFKGSRNSPIIINNSTIGNIDAGEGCRIRNSFVSKNVKLGRFVSINGPATRIGAHINRIEIGSYTSIASNVVIQEYYHRYNRLSSYYISQNILNEGVDNDIYSKGKIIIEEDVWIGSNCTILSGVKIGRGSIIGAGSVVTRDVPRYSIVAGNPARVIKKRFNNEIINLLEASKWWNWPKEMIIKNKEIFLIEDDKLLEKKLKELFSAEGIDFS